MPAAYSAPPPRLIDRCGISHSDAATERPRRLRIELLGTCDLSGVRPRQRQVGQRRFAQGECQRLVLETLRDAPEPLSDRQVEAAVAASKGVEAQSPARAGLEKTTLATLRRLAKKGAIRALALPDGRRAWQRA